MEKIKTPFDVRSTAADVLEGVSLEGRHILVTGGTSGLGAAAVRALEDAGALVTAHNRDLADLSDISSVNAFAADWDRPLDAIIANAGIMALPKLERAANGWELQLATNFLGHFALISGLRRHLRPGARIVLVSSGAQLGAPVDFDDPQFERRPYDPWTAYAQSKTADVLLAVALSRKFPELAANAMAPGYILTNLQRHLDRDTMRAFGVQDDGATPDYYKTPEQGASTEVLLAASPLLDGVTGRYFAEDNQEAEVVPGGAGQQTGVADWAVDPRAADRLWDLAVTALR